MVLGADLVDSGAILDTLTALRERGVAFDADGATWLRSTDFGDDKDRVLVKSDGEYTYLLPDIAYHRNKFDRSDRLINVWGADHHGYIVRMKAAMASLGHDADKLEIEITQLVDLLKDGEPVKLSKRAGNVVELRDVIDEVGADAARLTYLLQSIDSRQTIDLAEVASQGMDNPVFLRADGPRADPRDRPAGRGGWRGARAARRCRPLAAHPRA
ncbi:MAG: arginine--tRNA ligase [Acidimicrobiales bacterium]